MPFVTYEAEDARTDGALIAERSGEDHLRLEASGTRAVRIARGGFVEFTLARAADGLTVRYALPDSKDGKGIDARLDLSAGGKLLAGLPVTSRYSYYYGKYPFTNRPADGKPRHLYDHARIRLPRLLAAGTRLRVALPAGSAAQWAAIDLIDAERVPPPSAAPSNALSVAGFGADPSGRRTSIDAFRRGIAAAQKARRPLWIPPGRYRVDGHLLADRVTIIGAGHWWSVLRGDGVGIYGQRTPAFSSEVTLRDFAIVGEVTRREDHKQVAAIGGAFSNSAISGLWLQHTKVGLWLDGPMDRLTVDGLRIVDQAADGLNFHGGVTNSVARNLFVRGSGDDGLAMWSHRHENSGNRFEHNTVIAPDLANGIALYGGRHLIVSGNLVADSVAEGGGIHLGARFHAIPFAGMIAIASNSIVRGGSFDHNWKFGVGAFWAYALDQPIATDIRISDLDLIDSRFPALHMIGKSIGGLAFDGVQVDGAGTAVLQLQSPGEASFRNVRAGNLGGPAVRRDNPDFRIIDRGGNRGWDPQGAKASIHS